MYAMTDPTHPHLCAMHTLLNTIVERLSIALILPVLIAPSPSMAISNDECDGAIVLTVGAGCVTTTGDWTDATQSATAIACEGGASDSAHDVWYTFMASSEHTVVGVQSGSGNDAVVEVLGGTCGTLFSLACADATLMGGLESMVLNTTPGWTYFVRTYWWDYGGIPSDAAFSICVYDGPASPGNDACNTVAPELLLPGENLEFGGTSIGADTIGDYAESGPWQGAAPSTWHAFTIEACAQVIVRYCGTSPAFENVWTALTMQCPADTMILASEFDLSSCGDANVSMVFDSLAAGTYYLPVLSDPDLSYGSYAITVTAIACTVGVEEVTPAAGGISCYPDGGILITLANDPSDRGLAEWFSLDGRSSGTSSVRRDADGRFHVHERRSNAGRIEVFRFTTPNGTNLRSLVGAP